MKPENRKQEILKVAAKLFKDKGYSAVTMRDLAKALGIKAASLYNHISSKQDILQDIIISIAEDFTEGMHQIIQSDKDCLGKLQLIIDLHIRIGAENANGLAALNSDWMHLENKLDYYLDLRLGYENSFKAIVQDGIIYDEIKPIDPDVFMFSTLSTLRSLYLWLPKKEVQNLEYLSNQLSEVLLKGINK